MLANTKSLTYISARDDQFHIEFSWKTSGKLEENSWRKHCPKSVGHIVANTKSVGHHVGQYKITYPTLHISKMSVSSSSFLLATSGYIEYLRSDKRYLNVIELTK